MFQTKWAAQWDGLMTEETISILEDIEQKVSADTYYPARENVLRFLNMETPVKYAIIGMDPYPSWNERDNCTIATGRSFEVSELYGQGWDYKIKQASLRNMLKALYYNETGTNPPLGDVRAAIENGAFQIAPPSDWFNSLEAQGVLFLNSTLTVKAGKPGSHQSFWEPFRAVLIPYLENMGCRFMLWGSNAQNEIPPYLSVTARETQVLTAPHPRMANFVTENTFCKAPDINWLGQ